MFTVLLGYLPVLLGTLGCALIALVALIKRLLRERSENSMKLAQAESLYKQSDQRYWQLIKEQQIEEAKTGEAHEKINNRTYFD